MGLASKKTVAQHELNKCLYRSIHLTVLTHIPEKSSLKRNWCQHSRDDIPVFLLELKKYCLAVLGRLVKLVEFKLVTGISSDDEDCHS